jgi:hypothetical protein
MSQAVVVFSFPEPQDSITLGMIIESAKKSFANMPDVKIHLGIKDVANQVTAIFDPSADEKSNLVMHARRELERLNNDDDFNRSILNAIRGFTSYGHSGGSAEVAISIIHDLLQFKNISPLTNDPKEWAHSTEEVFGEPGGVWQNRRCGEAFSSDGGKTYTLLSEKEEGKESPIHYSAQHIKET